MTIKIYFNDQIHRVTQFPSNLDAFFAFINSLYGEKLPKTWSLQYSDQDGDQVRVSDDQDYKGLVELEAQTPGTITKLFIVSGDFSVQQEDARSQERLNENIEERKSIENSKQARKAESKEFGHAKKLLKKILKGKLSETENLEAIQQLEQIQAQFTPEKREKFEAQRERLELKRKFMNKLTAENQGKLRKIKDDKCSKMAKFGKLKKVMLRIQQQSPENAPIIFMTIKIFIKLFKAVKKGKTSKIEQYQLQLLSFLPEENPTTFEELFASIPKDLPKGELKERLFEIAKLYYREFCPENNNIFEELEQIRQAKKEKSPKGIISKEKKKELKIKYSKPVLKTAIKMKVNLPGEEIEKLCEFVKQTSLDLKIEQLVDQYTKQ